MAVKGGLNTTTQDSVDTKMNAYLVTAKPYAAKHLVETLTDTQNSVGGKLRVCTDLFKPYQYVRESNCLTNFLDHGCFATQNLVGDKNQFAMKITKPLPAGKQQNSAMWREESV